MFENIAYIGIGFAVVFLVLETTWHFTACKIHDRSIKPCFYKQVGLLKQQGLSTPAYLLFGGQDN